VHSSSAYELRKELDEKGPADWDGKRGDAFTHWKVVWRWPKDRQGQPHFEQALIKTEIHVTLPQWNAPPDADSKLKEDWDAFMRAIIQHERGHVRHAQSLRPRIIERILARIVQSGDPTLAEANTITRQVVDEIREEDRVFDARTDYGRLEGVRFPRVR
jgi:predicted secreted Zn-dependent protease